MGGAVGGTSAASTLDLTGNAAITGDLPAANQAAQTMGGAIGGTTAASTLDFTGNAAVTGVLPAANQAAQDASVVTYTPATPADWSGSPATVQAAIDRMAAVVSASGSSPIP